MKFGLWMGWTLGAVLAPTAPLKTIAAAAPVAPATPAAPAELVESGGSVSVVNRWSYDGDPPPARRYVAFRGGGALNFIIGGWF